MRKTNGEVTGFSSRVQSKGGDVGVKKRSTVHFEGLNRKLPAENGRRANYQPHEEHRVSVGFNFSQVLNSTTESMSANFTSLTSFPSHHPPHAYHAASQTTIPPQASTLDQ